MFNKIQSAALSVATKPVFAWLTVLILTLGVAYLPYAMPIGGGN